MSLIKIFYPTGDNPFVLSRDQIITPICTRGYTGAPVIKLVLQELLSCNNNIRNPYGITADPKFVFVNDDAINNAIINKSDVTLYSKEDEFEKVFGFVRNDNLQNAQTIIMNEMSVSKIIGYNKDYCDAIKKRIWNFQSDKQRVFILMTMDEREIAATVENLVETDILVIFKSYNLVAYPPNGEKPFSVNAYKTLINKIKKYFVSAL